MAEAREARRRRILERGADRIDYITGKLKRADLLQPSAAAIPRSAPPEDLNAESGASVSQILETAAKSLAHVRSEIEANEQSGQGADGWLGEDDVPLPSAAALSGRISQDRDGKNEVKESKEKPQIKSLSPLSSSVFTHKGLSSAVDFSVKPRAALAALIGVLTALKASGLTSHFPHGYLLDRAIPSRPISLILVTDALIIMSVLFLGFVKLSPSPPGGKQYSESDGVSVVDALTKALNVADAVGRVLHPAMLLAKAARAIFLDCSIYLVLLVSFLPFAEQLAAWIGS